MWENFEWKWKKIMTTYRDYKENTKNGKVEVKQH